MTDPTITIGQASPPARRASMFECGVIDGLLRLALAHGHQSTQVRFLAGSIRRLWPTDTLTESPATEETPCPA
jgi:hypothetical protein